MTEKPLTRRRAETRQRLLDAALEAFAEQGYGATSVEQVCARANFTRGAFYSNFDSLDELFLAMWEQRSAQLLHDLEELLAAPDEANLATLRDAVAHVADAVPVDDEWYRVTAEFTAHALRNPILKQVVAAREDAILATLLPLLDRLMATVGRRITDRDALGHALVAAHDGTTVQCLIEDDQQAARTRRTDLFTVLVEHYTEEI
ncbi:TetR/AcrR family transcriptional regulator [Nocardioides humilatus]|uniref:TetR/AcrR family transcriptional regulator n=1 Tax=Nocardioides humilatus TaxID=2607660 RepID=UPI001FEA532D|nr:TetR/AcrR family transcriptional regulator [Nocardioides humilatus]